MYEILDIPRMMQVKAQNVRTRSRPPARNGSTKNKVAWSGMILVSAGLRIEKLQLLPSGAEIKLCISDKSFWEILLPVDYEQIKIKSLAKRLDAIAFM